MRYSVIFSNPLVNVNCIQQKYRKILNLKTILFIFTIMKAEILKKLSETGQINVFKHSKEWGEAFEAYKKETGDLHIGTKCGSCYRKVLQWLKR